MPHLRNPQNHGDLLARIKVNLPRNLSKDQIVLFEKLANSK
jgi:DnaJ-class molecular chaperone